MNGTSQMHVVHHPSGCQQLSRRARKWNSATHIRKCTSPGAAPNLVVTGWGHQDQQATSTRRAILLAAGLLVQGLVQGPAHAHIPTNSNAARAVLSVPPEANLGIPPDTQVRPLGAYPSSRYITDSRQTNNTANNTASRAKEAISRLEAAHTAIDQGQFDEALENYAYVVQNYGDLALASYARTGRALMLYQVGKTSDALLALEDQEVMVRGTAEVHAALAALLWVERPNLAFRAEQQWEVAREFDSRYSNLDWVAADKHWPPKALDALNKFLKLTR